MSEHDPSMEHRDVDGGDQRDTVRLARAFADACFHVELGDRLHTLRVGQPQPVLEEEVPGTRYGYVTAWNPDAEPRDAVDNMAADDRLAARVTALGFDMRRTWSEDAQGAHREAGWLLVDANAEQVDALGRAFDQAGVLAWAQGEPVRLRMLMAPPPQAAELPWVDWIE